MAEGLSDRLCYAYIGPVCKTGPWPKILTSLHSGRPTQSMIGGGLWGSTQEIRGLK